MVRYVKEIFLGVLVSFLVSTQAFATYLPTQANFTIDGRTYVPPPSIMLYCGGNGGAAWRSTCSRQGVTTGYLPSAGKVFRVKIIRTRAISSANIGVGYGDTDVGVSSASAPTNPIYSNGLSSTDDLSSLPTNTGVSWTDYNMDFVVPNGKYVFIEASAASQIKIHVWGDEESP